MYPTLRTIVEEENVRCELDAKRKKDSRLDELWRGLGWQICREPEKGFIITVKNKPYYSMILNPEQSPKLQGIFVVYTFNNNEVNVLTIRVDEPT